MLIHILQVKSSALHYQRKLHLPARKFDTLTVKEAVDEALEQKLIVIKGKEEVYDRTPGDDSSIFNECNLSVRPNCGAVLTVGDHLTITPNPKQEVTDEHSVANKQEVMS